jgi:hypothetical protein
MFSLMIISIERIKERKVQDIYENQMNAPDPDCPTGHVKIDNNQRSATLKQLHASEMLLVAYRSSAHPCSYLDRTELENKLGHLPIRNDSATLRRTKDTIEKKIIELDEAINIFSKPKVFIRLE